MRITCQFEFAITSREIKITLRVIKSVSIFDMPLKMKRLMKKIHDTMRLQRHSSSFFTEFQESRENVSFNRIISEAEKIIGNNSFRNLQWLINDDVVNIARHFKKVMATKHSLVNVIRNIVENSEISYGLIVLLFCKAAGLKIDSPEQQKYFAKGILESQHVVAKVAEMLKMCSTIHRQIENASDDANINYGNKITLLSGDFLLCECLKELSNLRDQYLVELMSSGLRDLTVAQYVGSRDKNNRPIPTKPDDNRTDVSYLLDFSCDPIIFPNAMGNAKGEWGLRNTLGGASLLGKACSSAMKLANHPTSFQNVAFSFGKNFGLAYRAQLDIHEFLGRKNGPFSLVSAPVLFQLQDDPYLFEEIIKYQKDIDDVDYNVIREIILNGSAIGKTFEMRNEYTHAAFSVLESFEESDAKIVLKDILQFISS